MSIRLARNCRAITTTTAVGIYSVAGTLGELLGVISFGVSQVVFRRMASREMGTWYPRVRRVTLLLTMCSCVVMALAVPFIVLGVLGPDYRGAIQISYVLIAASLPFASYHLDVAALCGLGRLKSARRVNAVAAVFLLVCCVVTIPAMQAWGATISSTLTYCVMAVYARWEMARNVPRHHGREANPSAFHHRCTEWKHAGSIPESDCRFRWLHYY